MHLVRLPVLLSFGCLILTGCAPDPPSRNFLTPTSRQSPVVLNAANNDLPMYGTDKGFVKTPSQLAADRKFAENVQAQGYTPETAAQRSVYQGWKYFAKGDLSLAMHRFNHAWLMNSENGDIYNGFAVIQASRDAPETEVVNLFELAMSKPGVNSRVYMDYARYLRMKGRKQQAMLQLERALALDSHLRNARRQIAEINYELGNKAAACKWGREAIRSGVDAMKQSTVDDFCRL